MGVQETESAETGFGTFFRDTSFVVVLLIQFVGLFGTNVPSPALASMATDIGISDARVGLVMMAFSLPAIVAVPVVGVLVDMYGRRTIVLLSLFLLGSAGLLIPFVGSFWFILVLRGLQGIGYAGTTPLTVTLIGDLFTGREGSTAQGYLISASGAASIIVPASAGYLLSFGWEASFGLYGIVLIVCAIAFVYLPHTLPEEQARADVHLTEKVREYWRSIRSELHDSDIAILYTGAFVEYFIKYGMITFLPLFAIRELGIGGFFAGTLISLYGVVRVLVSPQTGRLVGRLGQEKAIIVASVLVALGIGSFVTSTSLALLIVPVIVYSAGDAFLAPLLNDAVATKASEAHRGGVVSGMNMMKNVGKTLAPAALGVVLALFDYRTLFVVTGLSILPYLALVGFSLRIDEPSA